MKLTADRQAYKKGELIEDQSGHYVIPRDAVYRSRRHCGQYRIRAYDWRDRLAKLGVTDIERAPIARFAYPSTATLGELKAAISGVQVRGIE